MKLRGFRALVAGLVVLILIALFLIIVLNILLMLIPIVLVIVIAIVLYRYFFRKIDKIAPKQKKANKKETGIIDAEFKIKD